MKRLFFAVIAIVAAIGSLSSCDKETEMVIDYDALPSTAQSTISTHFDSSSVVLVRYEKEYSDAEYTVIFSDGTVIEFDGSGVWNNIEASVVGVPESIIPESIYAYAVLNYPEMCITEIDKESYGYELKIGSVVELRFTSSGVLIGIGYD